MRSAFLWVAGLVGLAVAFPFPNRPTAPARPLPVRQMEPLGRGLVAIHPEEGKIFLSWRLLGTDPDGIAFHVYRRPGDAEPVRLTDKPLTQVTCFTDTAVDLSKPTTYIIRPVVDGKELDSSAPFKLPANPPVRVYLSIPLKTLPGHTPNDAAVGDLDGDGDLLRELLDRTAISKWDWEKETETVVLLRADGCASNNGTKATPCLSADILGDWREEVIWRSADNTELRIYTTPIPTEHRLYTLMHDPQYRLAVAWQNVGYNQPPHPGFFLGHDMKPPPRPRIVTRPGR